MVRRNRVEVAIRAVRLLQATARQWDQRQANRDVQPEDVFPGEPAGDGAADDGAERHAQAGYAGPDAEGQSALPDLHGF